MQALVRGQWDEGDDRPGVFPGGAALLRGRTAFVLLEDDPAHGLGGALAWALRQAADELRVLASASGGVLARRAAAFDFPVEVHEVDGRSLTASPAAPVAEVPVASEVDRSWAPVFEVAGAEAVEEWGVVTAEVLGLEVARVVDGELKVGVGKHDRWAHEELGSTDLDSVIAVIKEHRRAGSLHQAALLVRDRWLRCALIARPELIGLRDLAVAQPPEARNDLQQRSIAPALAEETLVVCSVGADLDLVPAAADALALAGGGRELVIVVPEGDDHRVTHDLAAVLRSPARVQTVPPDWQSLLDV